MAGLPDLPQLAERCQALGLPLTVQRRAILEVLLARTDHPTADHIADALDQRLPGISRATVYRTLEVLVDNGLISRVSHPGAAARYDVRIDRHHHLVCDRCGEMSDFEAAALDGLALPDFAGSGFRVRDYSVQVRGLCRKCARAPQDKPGKQPTGKQPTSKQPTGKPRTGKPTTGKQEE